MKESDMTRSNHAMQLIQFLHTIALCSVNNIISSPLHHHSHSPFHSIFVCVFCSALHSIFNRVHLTQFNLILPLLTLNDQILLDLVVTRNDEANYSDDFNNHNISHSVYRLRERSYGTGEAIVKTI